MLKSKFHGFFIKWPSRISDSDRTICACRGIGFPSHGPHGYPYLNHRLNDGKKWANWLLSLGNILISFYDEKLVSRIRMGGANGEKWRIMANNGDGEFGFFICQIRHFSPIFDIGISYLTDF